MKKDLIEPFFATLRAANPLPTTELEFTTPFELLVGPLSITGLTAYFEIPIHGDLAPVLSAISRLGGRAKVRTGGTGVIVTDTAYHGITDAVSQFSPSLGMSVDLGPQFDLVQQGLQTRVLARFAARPHHVGQIHQLFLGHGAQHPRVDVPAGRRHDDVPRALAELLHRRGRSGKCPATEWPHPIAVCGAEAMAHPLGAIRRTLSRVARMRRLEPEILARMPEALAPEPVRNAKPVTKRTTRRRDDQIARSPLHGSRSPARRRL